MCLLQLIGAQEETGLKHTEEEVKRRKGDEEMRKRGDEVSLLLKYCRLPCPSEARNEVKSEGGPTANCGLNSIDKLDLECWYIYLCLQIFHVLYLSVYHKVVKSGSYLNGNNNGQQ